MLLALSAAMLTRLSNRGLASTLEARTRYKQLQEKWAFTSARLAILGEAERLFGDSDAFYESEGTGWPFPSSQQGEFEMGGVTYHLLLADEQAKLNLNTVYKHQANNLSQLLLELQRNYSAAIKLRTEAAYPQLTADQKNPFHTLGQIVDFPKMPYSQKNADGLVGFTQQFSYGQKTRLNVQRASDETLRNTARLVLSQAETEELIESRYGYVGSLSDWLRSVDLPSRRLLPLRRLLGESSQSYSLWVLNENQALLATQGDSLGNSKGCVLQWP